MAIRFFFEYEKRVVQLPVNPPSLAIASGSNNKKMEIISLGEINILRQRKLSSCAISCFFPSKLNESAPYVLTKGSFEEPQFYIDFFNKIRADKQPVRFIVTDTDINMLASIEAFTPERNAMDDDIEYKLELLEYRPYSAKEVKIETTPTNTVIATIPTTEAVTRPQTGFAVGDVVIANGKYWYTSTGASPYGMAKEMTVKIGHIVADKTRKYRYAIYTLSGGALGWVEESQLKR